MNKNYPEPINIRVRFHGHTVTLEDADSRQITPEGVEIWIERKPAGNFRPMAGIPEGTLHEFIHCRPQIIDWAEWTQIECTEEEK